MGRTTTLLCFAGAATILALPVEGFCQSRSTGGGSFAGGGGGSALGASSFGGGSGFGASSIGGSSFGQSSFGSGGIGQSGGGLSTSPFNSTGAGGFGAETAGVANQGFVGRGAEDVQSFFGGLGQQFQNAVQRSQRAALESRGGSSSSQRRPDVRVRLFVQGSLGRAAAPTAPRMSAVVDSIERSLERKALERVEVAADAGVVTLRGVVEDESQRLVVEKLASIEPGVDRVENELMIAGGGLELVPAPR